jgi:hypothetical protein
LWEVAVRLILAVFAVAFFSTAAMAQTAAERAACMADFEKYCTGVMPGGGRIIQCLAKQMDKLTPECRRIVQSHAPE